jgi:protoheme IX farnesyltransferase
MSVILDPQGTLELSATLSARAHATPRWREYLSLTKPRIAVMGLVTVALGFMLATTAEWSGATLGHALFGIGLVAASCSTLNQWWERDSDRRMVRTANRPLPSGRLLPGEVLSFGLLLGTIGLADLMWFVNGLTAALSAVTLLLYVVVYTPLKRRTSLCTTIGAIPGAMPPVLGWVAAGGELNAGAFALFATLFVWQFPHFLAIAWLYREQYTAAGLRMLPQTRPAPRITGWLCVGYALAVIPVSLLPKDAALAGDRFALIAVVLGLGYVAFSVRFLLAESARTARQLLWFSLVYLPALLLALTWDHWRLLS